MAKYDSCVICTSPRSGSTLLCRLMAATGVAGNPESYFHRLSIEAWREDLEVGAVPGASERELLAAIFKAVIAKGSLETGLFGLRLQRHSFDFFTEKLAVLYPSPATDALRFQAAFGRTLFVHLTRRDKIGQAVSWVKAEQSGLWHLAPDGTELERLSPHRDPIYDAGEIQACVKTMQDYDRDWMDWFEAQDIEPLRITYDALSENPVATLRDLLGRLGLDPHAASSVTPGVRKLADATSEDWVARFRSQFDMSASG
ncbi:LPS sulfotransferase NodH [Hoeflea marina]|uniref:LPS sulfotransferase NodH n=1 Tax=Hoeflea marina TaxID=274592 RepID=A0A317PST2_9HYPH|nr:Stf0 family sulfotransferase [Hoeflea marina]PWW01884.1 LPS sulfotransferase NodH [Hoeflea marina]